MHSTERKKWRVGGGDIRHQTAIYLVQESTSCLCECSAEKSAKTYVSLRRFFFASPHLWSAEKNDLFIMFCIHQYIIRDPDSEDIIEDVIAEGEPSVRLFKAHAKFGVSSQKNETDTERERGREIDDRFQKFHFHFVREQNIRSANHVSNVMEDEK